MKNRNSKLYVYGINVAKEILTHQAERVLELYVLQGKAGDNEDVALVAAVARKIGITVRQVPEKNMREYVGQVRHQGVVIKMKSFDYAGLDDMLAGITTKNPAILIMEQIEDPHNVGAIIRSATALGVDGLVMLNHSQAPVNATSFKTSAGTVGRIPIARVSNLLNTIESLKKQKYWIAGLAMGGESIEGNAQLSGTPMAFILGNEGVGLKESTMKACDFLLSIPMNREVESLNASVSAAVLMYEWRRQRSV